MPEPMQITTENMPRIATILKMSCESDKHYQVSITLYDASLKAGQRALANIWYQDIAREQGTTVGAAEAFCKYTYGFKIRCEDDPDLAEIIRNMLNGRDYEAKLKIIEIYPEWFPILRNKSGMNVEQQGRYLNEIQRNFGAQGIFLTSSSEQDLLNYPEAR